MAPRIVVASFVSSELCHGCIMLYLLWDSMDRKARAKEGQDGWRQDAPGDPSNAVHLGWLYHSCIMLRVLVSDYTRCRRPSTAWKVRGIECRITSQFTGDLPPNLPQSPSTLHSRSGPSVFSFHYHWNIKESSSASDFCTFEPAGLSLIHPLSPPEK